MYNPGSGDGKLKKNRIFSNHTPLLFFIERDMTDKEKAKAYDEALERAKAMIDDLRKGEDILAVSDLEAMFPELRESEDERIRKELINFILYKAKGVSEEQEHSWVTYLEKQKEQKPTNSEKPKEWSEEDDALLKEIVSFFKDGTVKLQHDLDLYAGFLQNKFKSLRPQPREEIYQSAKHDLAIKFMNYLDENRPEGKMCLSNGECEDIDKAFKENDWAKIMRYVEKYRTSWKPSDEQMQCLLAVITNQYNAGAESCHLTLGSLYNDLKKLI